MENTGWIWTSAPCPTAHSYIRFRKVFEASAGAALSLSISADARYWLWVNGTFVGHGPVRSWPAHWKYDEYDISPYVRSGANVVAVLVHRLGIGTFQYLPASPGLVVQIREGEVARVATDESWRCAPSAALALEVPRISVQQAFEEQFDARKDDGWHDLEFDDGGWPPASLIEPPHDLLEEREIPFLSSETIWPVRVVRVEKITSEATTWSIDARRFLAPEDPSSKVLFARGLLCTQIWSEQAQTVTFVRPHHHGSPFRVNGVEHAGTGPHVKDKHQPVVLLAGWNSVAFPWPSLDRRDGGSPSRTHAGQFALGVRSFFPLRWCVHGEAGGVEWAFAGPFGFSSREHDQIALDRDFPRVLVLPPEFDEHGRDLFLLAYDGEFSALECREIPAEFIAHHDVFVAAYADESIGTDHLENPDALTRDDGWTVIEPPSDGEGVRILLDFGHEVLGCHEFTVEAGEGTILDFHSFEFIQPDGRENLAEGMNNTFRYICREGLQHYRSLLRRGFQYTYLIVRNITAPVRIKSLAVDFVAYPQTNVGSFKCSDPALEKIWSVGAHTLRCCAEDTYTDCPSYEQVLWVGDARNEALIDWVVNGDPRLWFRCLLLAGQSLETGELPLTASQVPSAWPNIIPAWSFLWMRSCSEYLLWTGDYEGARELFPWIIRNVDGIERHRTAEGLFSIQAYNLFDWAGMDTPTRGIVTHNNCFAVHALRDAARLARWLQQDAEAMRFEAMAVEISDAVNELLWDTGQQAYLDSIHADGGRSATFSQQTQAVARLSGVASGGRARRCAEILDRPPEQFVRSGSPFFEFFRLECLILQGLSQECLDAIRGNWGFMVDQGATTFWEMWSRTGRLTRSHCHGWSAAPTYFLSAAVLGITPVEPGFRLVRIEPRLGDLVFAEGVMPTPFGEIKVRFRQSADGLVEEVFLPPGVLRV